MPAGSDRALKPSVVHGANATLLALAAFAPRTGAPLAAWLVGAGGSLACFVLLVRLARAQPASPWFEMRGVFLAALLARALPFVAEPWSSDDHHRYVWEGEVQRAGHSPYLHAPDDPLLEALRDENWEKVAHRSVPAAYPPVAQAVFRFTAYGTRSLRTVLLAADLGLLAVLLAALRRRGEAAHRALPWSQHPLAVLCFAGGAHFDVLALLPLCAAVLWLDPAAPATRLAATARTVLLGLAACVKPQAAAGLLPDLERRRFAIVVGTVLAVVVFSAPQWIEGKEAFAGTSTYAAHWEFGGLVFPLARSALIETKSNLEALGDSHHRLRRFGYDLVPQRDARRLCALLFALLVAASFRWHRNASPAQRTRDVLFAFLLTAPTFYPWYAAWLLPFLCGAAGPATLVLCGTALLGDLPAAVALTSGEFREPRWLGAAIWIPPLAVAAITAARRSR